MLKEFSRSQTVICALELMGLMSQKMKQDSCMVYSESQAIVWRCLRDHMYCHFGTKPISNG